MQKNLIKFCILTVQSIEALMCLKDLMTNEPTCTNSHFS